MKKFLFLIVLAAWFVPGAFAQGDNEHVQVGVFADYFRLSQTGTDMVGVGARASVVGYKRLKFEAEASYDFSRAFNEQFINGPGGINFQRTNVRVVQGMFGPRVNLGRHWIQPFVTVKGGAMSFQLDNGPATVGNFFSSVGNLRSNSVIGSFYPGGGLEGHIGPVGLRLDVGDQIYFNGGTHNNLKVTFGPVFRF